MNSAARPQRNVEAKAGDYLPDMLIALLFLSIVSAMGFLFLSMYYGAQFYPYLGSMLYYYEEFIYDHPLVHFTLFIQPRLFTWSFIPIIAYILVKTALFIWYPDIKKITRPRLFMAVLLAPLFLLGSFTGFYIYQTQRQYLKEPPPQQSPWMVAGKPKWMTREEPPDAELLKDEKKMELYFKKREITEGRERFLTKELSEITVKSVEKMLEWSVLLMTALGVLFVREVSKTEVSR